MMKLYELTDMYLNLQDMDANPEDLKIALENITDEIELKAENIGKVLRNLNSEVDAIETEILRLKNKKRSIENRKKNLKDYLKYQMELVGLKKIKTPLFSFNIQKNRASIQILDESKIPEDYFKVTKIPIKTDILEAYKNGVITDGIEIVQTESLRIR